MSLGAIRECNREETQLGDFWKKEKQTKPKETWASQDKLKYDFLSARAKDELPQCVC
jgi:hypothetical protein